MDKRVMLIIVSVLGAIVIAVGTGYYFLNQQQAPVISQAAPTPTPVIPSTTLKDYNDPSGFALQYPDDITLKQQEITDKITYSDIEFTNPSVPGKITVKVQDTKLPSLEAWVTQNKATTSAGTVKNVTLGGLEAREITLSDKILTVAIDQNILFTIEVTPQTEKQYWENVYNTLLTSFNFSNPQQSTDTSTGTSTSSEDDISFEGEEVVE